MNDLSFHPGAGTNGTGLDQIAKQAITLGREIVEIAAALDLLAQNATEQMGHLTHADRAATIIQSANERVITGIEAVAGAAQRTQDHVAETTTQMRETAQHAQKIASWVTSVAQRMSDVGKTLAQVQSENSEIRQIASQVNILAINAKIEAVRAGDAGRGFAVVAEAINELSRKTANAAGGISQAIEGLDSGIQTLRKEAENITDNASRVLSGTVETDQAMSRMTASVDETRQAVGEIAQRANEVREANSRFAPAFGAMTQAMKQTGTQVTQAQKRTTALITVGETIVQNSVQLGGALEDAALIDFVQQEAAKISEIFTQAVASGQIETAALFDRRYEPIEGTNPQQVMARFTLFTDKVLPPIQEAALELDGKIVFCAAVDENGYLPTHNRKFSKPQGADPAWNTANCRNRRIFDDRVGLRAGRSTAPFVLQIYRRDMGDGHFVLMKDLSAPITVNGRHWGGLRIAYAF
ncbi:methyl-accepting chemotaxis protein [Thioclava litoralis]|uniref:Methyl-accepting chemotaxis protein n=1 Tax=Thioclava litoralis TaxID=3076557 RepID=A0ABZ1DX20_9RHOB|nr:methyl-accepting chemotaxis protein [Thioclava sp. FTW29]